MKLDDKGRRIRIGYKEYMKSIRETKERIVVEDDYSPYLMNRALKNKDNILEINKVNKKGIDKQLHYDYLLEIIPKKK